MSTDDPNLPPADDWLDDDSSDSYVLDSSSNQGVPPPPPPPPPIWNAPDSAPGWRVGQFSNDTSDDDDAGWGEKPKRKRGLDDGGTGRTFAWHEAWIAAVTQPATATYEALIRDPRASLQRAALWLGALGLLGYVLQFGFLGLVGLGSRGAGSLIGSTVGLVICAPIAVGLMLALLALGWGLQYAAARILGGAGTYDQHFYALACYTAPMMIAGMAGFIPCFGPLVALVLGAYQLVLNVIAVKAVHGLDWGRAFVATFWLALVLCGCLCCAVMMAGPAVGGVFENALESLYTPTP